MRLELVNHTMIRYSIRAKNNTENKLVSSISNDNLKPQTYHCFESGVLL